MKIECTPDEFKDMMSIGKSNITYEIDCATDDVYSPYITELIECLEKFEKDCKLKGNVVMKLGAYLPLAKLDQNP